MVRESRHLKVQGISSSISADKLQEQFGRYGPIEKVTLIPKKDGEELCAALVDFVDIKSATTAHETVNVVDGREVQTEYTETASVSRAQGKNRQERQNES